MGVALRFVKGEVERLALFFLLGHRLAKLNEMRFPLMTGRNLLELREFMYLVLSTCANGLNPLRLKMSFVN